MLEIFDSRIYNMAEAIVASGFPMKAEYNRLEYLNDVIETRRYLESGQPDDNAFASAMHHVERAVKLARLGSPHCNYLTGILVTMNVKATQAFFLQAHRYHWWQVVSSQSKMHRLKKMMETEAADCNEKVICTPNEMKDRLDLNDVEQLVYNCPMGLQTVEHVTLNYQQIRTIYHQRKTHRLQEWRDFCEWIEGLPMSELITCNSHELPPDNQSK